MRLFHRTREGFVADLDRHERIVLSHLAGQVRDLLLVHAADQTAHGVAGSADVGLSGLVDPGLPSEAIAPEDSAAARLLPPASTDPDVAQEFRDLTQAGIAAYKVERLTWFADLMMTGGGRRGTKLAVSPDDAPRLAAVLTDLRLVVADRLELHDDADTEALEDEIAAGGATPQRAALSAVFTVIGMLQETLVQCMLDGLRSPGGERPATS